MLKAISFILFIVFVVVTVSYVTLASKGEQMFAEAISDATGRETTVRDAGIIFPLTLRLDGLKVEGLLEATETKVGLDLNKLLQGRLKFSHVELLYPVFYLERSNEGNLFFGQKIYRSSSKNVSRDHTGANVREHMTFEQEGIEQFDITGLNEGDDIPSKPLVIEQVTITDGRVVFIDLSGNEKKSWTIDEVFLTAQDVPVNFYPVKTKIDMTASLMNTSLPFVGQEAHLKGWVNWAHKNMDATLTIGDGGDGVGLDAALVSSDNDLTVSGKVNLGGGPKNTGSSLEDAVLGALFAADASIAANFSFQTRMDRIQLSNISFGGNFTSGLDEKSSDEIVDSLKEVKQSLGQLTEQNEEAEASTMDDTDALTGTVSATVE